MQTENENASPWTISSKLNDLEFETDVNVDHNGQRLDLLAFTPNGISLAIEIKNWHHLTTEMISKAKKQSKLLAEAAEVNNAWIVIPSLPDAQQEDCVFNLNGSMKAAKALISLEPDFGLRGTHGTRQKKSGLSLNKEKRRVFVAMPFSEQFEDTYYLGIIPAARRASAICVRVDQQDLSKQIVETIYSEIRLSDMVIADLTNANPNVTYELGFAHALEKPSIHISANQPENLPFDLRQWSTHFYKFGSVHELTKKLSEMIQHILIENKYSKRDTK
ncbi:MAG TPA: hypothetical protein VN843_09930 [Anaerolineales bacterium]|nr:hypothetical protein [Anaerolineales bacterium]